MKPFGSVPLPALVVTTMSTAPGACAATVTVRLIEIRLVTLLAVNVAAVPPNVTDVTSTVWAVTMTTLVPPMSGAELGVAAPMAGGASV